MNLSDAISEAIRLNNRDFMVINAVSNWDKRHNYMVLTEEQLSQLKLFNKDMDISYYEVKY